MAKKKNDKIKHYYIIIVTIILIFGASLKVYGHFAKTTTVEALARTVIWVEERLAIGTHDQRVERQQQAVDRARNRLRFEAKIGKPMAVEIEEVKLQEERLRGVIKERDELVKQYQSKK